MPDDDLRDRIAEAIARIVLPDYHGQLCPVWTERLADPPVSVCDCWVLPGARKQADAALSVISGECR